MVPLVEKNTSASKKNEQVGSTLGIETVKEQANKSLNTGFNSLDAVVKPAAIKLQQEVGTVLGIAQQTAIQTVQDVASKSADQAKEFVFDSTFGKILQNINTLPSDQQDLIKKSNLQITSRFGIFIPLWK